MLANLKAVFSSKQDFPASDESTSSSLVPDGKNKLFFFKILKKWF